MKFGGLESYFRGLDGVIGQPATDLDAGIHREHARSRDSQQAFKAPNYGTRTTSEIEYYFVTDPRSDHCTTFEIKCAAEDAPAVAHCRPAPVMVDVLDTEVDGWPTETKLEGFEQESIGAGAVQHGQAPSSGVDDRVEW